MSLPLKLPVKRSSEPNNGRRWDEGRCISEGEQRPDRRDGLKAGTGQSADALARDKKSVGSEKKNLTESRTWDWHG